MTKFRPFFAMSRRRTFPIAALALATLGCDQGSHLAGLGGATGASVRFINATDAALDLTTNGQVIGAAGHVPAGASTTCLEVDPATAKLGIRPSGAADIPGFAPTLDAGKAYTVIVLTGETGQVQAVTLSDEFTPAAGGSALRVFDAAPGTGSLDVYVTAPADPLTGPSDAAVGFGGGTPFFDVSAGTSRVRFTVATTTVLALDAGEVTLAPGSRSTLVLAPPMAGSVTPAVVLVPAC